MAILETWNGRTAGQTDADSPLDSVLMDGIRKDLDHLKQVLYGNSEASGTYLTPVWGHNHDGVNSKNVLAAHQFSFRMAETAPHTETSWTTVHKAQLYVPAGITTINVRIRAKAASGQVDTRLKIDTNTGTEVHYTGTSYADQDLVITPTAGQKGTYIVLEIQGQQAGGNNWYLHKDVEVIGGFNFDYATASYFST